MQVLADSGAHWNSHGKFDFRLGKVQLASSLIVARSTAVLVDGRGERDDPAARSLRRIALPMLCPGKMML